MTQLTEGQAAAAMRQIMGYPAGDEGGEFLGSIELYRKDDDRVNIKVSFPENAGITPEELAVKILMVAANSPDAVILLKENEPLNVWSVDNPITHEELLSRIEKYADHSTAQDTPINVKGVNHGR